ncbi:MAG: Eco57I restriction-modification methylase domain-containing protein [Candidatus Binataceae bacterium]
MKGFVPTPKATVDLMVSRLFRDRHPSRESTVLDPGCGTGAFVEGVLRWCEVNRIPVPHIVGIDSNPRHVMDAGCRFAGRREVEIRYADFLDGSSDDQFDFVIGNPPYVSILELSEEEKTRYRSRYIAAQGRFDLYILFFEQALRHVKAGGRLVFITPEKFLYVETARPLRKIIGQWDVEEINLLDEATFGPLVTYPTVTTLTKRPYARHTVVISRTGAAKRTSLPMGGASWISVIGGGSRDEGGVALAELCTRISAGVATGADQVFVKRIVEIDPRLKEFGYPTIAGRELGPNNHGLSTSRVMLIPYSRRGVLLAQSDLGFLGRYLERPDIRRTLMDRTCVTRKPWYAFHETPPLSEILRPKILCKDITARPEFWSDPDGRIVPRHSVYYIVPHNPAAVGELCEYLNSEIARDWLFRNCQRAATGFLRLQSSTLKRLPVPPELALRIAAEIGEAEPVHSRPASRRGSASPLNRAFEFAR